MPRAALQSCRRRRSDRGRRPKSDTNGGCVSSWWISFCSVLCAMREARRRYGGWTTPMLAFGASDFGLRPLSDLRAAKRLGLKNQVKGHRMPVDKPIATFLLFQVLAFGSASVGTILALVLWAWRIDQWEMMTDPFFWHLAGATMGTIFWGGCAAPFAQIAWQRRSWFFASTLLPGLVVFPLLIWRQLTVV